MQSKGTFAFDCMTACVGWGQNDDVLFSPLDMYVQSIRCSAISHQSFQEVGTLYKQRVDRVVTGGWWIASVSPRHVPGIGGTHNTDPPTPDLMEQQSHTQQRPG
jgi:hypothetical protein